MNSIELRLLGLLQIAETPVYSAYRWLNRQLGQELSIAEFLGLLVPLVDDDIVRLWAVDIANHERSRWCHVPVDLQERYRSIPDLDEGFDPFGLSLTLGPAADPEASPDWEIDFDLTAGSFVLTAKSQVVYRAEQQIRWLFPALDFAEKTRDVAGEGIRITGFVQDTSDRESH